MGASLLVIGGSGFFGKSILDAHRRGLLAHWDIARIVVVARDPEKLAREHADLLGPDITLLAADIATVQALPAADYVIHAASSSDARRYADYPLEERANILGAIDNYCRIAADAHRGSRIVYTSSGAVYGQQPPSIARIAEDFETTGVEGLVSYKHDYAQAKRLAEQRLAELGAAGLRVAVARCFAFVGLYLPRDQHFAIGNFIADGLDGRTVRVNATKRVYRSYMHADDLVCWLMTIAAAASSQCPIYNVGSDRGVLMGDLAAAVAMRCGVAAQVPPITGDDVDRYVPSTEKARTELGLSLAYPLEAALDDVIDRLRRQG